MAIYAPKVRTVAFAAQSGSRPTTYPTTADGFLPITRTQTTFTDALNIQDQEEATGDYFVLVDGIPQQPKTQATIVMPFRPSTMTTFLSHCCLPGGALAAPDPLTFWVFNGLDEDEFKDMFLDSMDLIIPATGEASINANFVGITPRHVNTTGFQTYVAPTYERGFRLGDLLGATFGSESSVIRINNFTVHVQPTTTLYYGSRGDGSNYASDAITQKLNASVDLVRAYQTAAVKNAFLTECGAPMSITLKLKSTCSAVGSATTNAAWQFVFPAALMYTEQIGNANDTDPIDETLMFKGLRTTLSASSFSPMVTTITAPS